MVKLCSLAIGKKHEMLALQLRASLPVDIAIYDAPRIAGEAIPFPPRKGFNFHCKRIPIEREYHHDGTLFLDADTTCVNQDTFKLFLESLARMEAGIHAVHAYNAYGDVAPVREGKFVSGLLAGRIRTEKLISEVAFLSNVFRSAEEDLIQMVFPAEACLFCKFKTDQQKDAFFDRWKLLEKELIGSEMRFLSGECYAIGMAACYAELTVKQFSLKAALNHKSRKI